MAPFLRLFMGQKALQPVLARDPQDLLNAGFVALNRQCARESKADAGAHEQPPGGTSLHLYLIMEEIREKLERVSLYDLRKIILSDDHSKLVEIKDIVDRSELSPEIKVALMSLVTRYLLLVAVCLVGVPVGEKRDLRARNTGEDLRTKEVDPERVTLYVEAARSLIKQFNHQAKTRKTRGRPPRQIVRAKVRHMGFNGDLPISFKDFLRVFVFVYAARQDSGNAKIKKAEVERLMDDERERLAAAEALFKVFPNIKYGPTPKMSAGAIFARSVSGRRQKEWWVGVGDFSVGKGRRAKKVSEILR